MQTLDVLKIAFKNPISLWEVPIFRAALANHLGWENEFLHGHRNRPPGPEPLLPIPGNNPEVVVLETSYAYDYPLVQFKTHFSNGRQRPLLLLMEEYADKGEELLPRLAGELQLNARPVRIGVASHRHRSFRLGTRQWLDYRLFNYQPFGPRNFTRYQSLPDETGLVPLLNVLLKDHLRRFAAGIGWAVAEEADVQVSDIRKTKWISCQGVKVLCFDLAFGCNFFLPEYLGLGKGVSKGFGVVRKEKKRLRD